MIQNFTKNAPINQLGLTSPLIWKITQFKCLEMKLQAYSSQKRKTNTFLRHFIWSAACALGALLTASLVLVFGLPFGVESSKPLLQRQQSAAIPLPLLSSFSSPYSLIPRFLVRLTGFSLRASGLALETFPKSLTADSDLPTSRIPVSRNAFLFLTGCCQRNSLPATGTIES